MANDPRSIVRSIYAKGAIADPEAGRSAVRHVLPNGYGIDVVLGRTGSTHRVQFSRFPSGDAVSGIPFVASFDALVRGNLRERLGRLLRGADPDRDLADIVRRVAVLPPANEPGAVVKSWGSDPASVLAAAIDWLRQLGPDDFLSGLVRSAGSARALIRDHPVQRYAETIRLRIEDAGRIVADLDYACADHAVAQALATVQDDQERLEAGLGDVEWRHGGDLTELLIRVGGTRSEGARAAAAYIGRDLTRSSPTPIEIEGGRLMKGASGCWNRLFSDDDWRLRHAEEFRKAGALAGLIRRSATRFPVTLWHGFGFQAEALRFMAAGDILQGRPGFFHASLSSSEAMKHVGLRPILARIQLRTGSPASFVDGHPYEHEVMLPPKTSFRLLGRCEREIVGQHDVSRCAIHVDLEPIFSSASEWFPWDSLL